MALADLIDAAERKRKTITVFAPEVPDAIAARFDGRHVTIEHEHVPRESDGFIVVSRDGEFLGSVELEALELIEHPPIGAPWQAPDRRANTEFRYLLELLDDTIFSSYDRRQMLGTAREIEDRAWRVGSGTLLAGFQSFSAMADQVEIYRQLALKGDLDVHVYGAADWEPPEIPGVTYHATTHPELTEAWFVAFDGGGNVLNECALLAVERSPERFYGFWTYDPVCVDRLIDTVRATGG